MSGEITELKKDIAASLWFAPADFDTLIEKDFLENKSHYGIERILLIMIRDKWIYQEGEVYHTYYNIAKTRLKEYEQLY